MLKPEVIEEVPLNLVEVKELLKKIKDRDQELNFRTQKTMEYLEAIPTIKPKSAKELKEKLEALNIPRMKDTYIHKIIDVMPQTVEGVKTLFNGLNVAITADNLKKISSLVGEYAEAPKKVKEEAPVVE